MSLSASDPRGHPTHFDLSKRRPDRICPAHVGLQPLHRCFIRVWIHTIFTMPTGECKKKIGRKAKKSAKWNRDYKIGKPGKAGGNRGRTLSWRGNSGNSGDIYEQAVVKPVPSRGSGQALSLSQGRTRDLFARRPLIRYHLPVSEVEGIAVFAIRSAYENDSARWMPVWQRAL